MQPTPIIRYKIVNIVFSGVILTTPLTKEPHLTVEPKTLHWVLSLKVGDNAKYKSPDFDGNMVYEIIFYLFMENNINQKQ